MNSTLREDVPRDRPASIRVLIPCRNEEDRIGAVIQSIRAAIPSANIVVIDDASDDQTGHVARECGAVVLRHGCNLGYGAALETGYMYASQHPCDLVLQMDGDGQHRAEYLSTLMGPLVTGEADIVIGSRYGIEASPLDTPPWMRRIGHRFFALIIFCLSGRRFTDPTSGFQALSPRAVQFFSSGVFPCDYPDSDVILMSLRAGLRVVEVPVAMKPRAGGKSMHAGIMPIYYGMKMMLSILIVLLNFRSWSRWKRKHRLSSPGR